MGIWEEADKRLGEEKKDNDLWLSNGPNKSDPIALTLSDNQHALAMEFIKSIREIHWKEVDVADKNTIKNFKYNAPDGTIRMAYRMNTEVPKVDILGSQKFIVTGRGNSSIWLYRDGYIFITISTNYEGLDAPFDGVINENFFIKWAMEIKKQEEHMKNYYKEKGICEYCGRKVSLFGCKCKKCGRID